MVITASSVPFFLTYRGSRPLRFSISTHLMRTVSIQHRRATGGKGSMLDSKLKNNYNPKYPTVQEQRFLPKVLSSKLGVKKQQQKWETPNVHWSQLPASQRWLPCHPHPRTITGLASICTHLLTGIWHKRAVDAETWKHLFLLFQRVRLWKAIQKQFCKQMEREGRHFKWFLSCLPALITATAINTQSFFSII